MAINRGNFSVYDQYDITYELDTRAGTMVASVSMDAPNGRRDRSRHKPIAPFSITYEDVWTADALHFLSTATLPGTEALSPDQKAFFRAMQGSIHKHIGGFAKSDPDPLPTMLPTPEAAPGTLKLPEMDFVPIGTGRPPSGTPLVFLAMRDGADEPISIQNGYFSKEDQTARDTSGADIEQSCGASVFAWAIAPWNDAAFRADVIDACKAEEEDRSQDERENVLLRGIETLVSSSSADLDVATLDVIAAMIKNVPFAQTAPIAEIAGKVDHWIDHPDIEAAGRTIAEIRRIAEEHLSAAAQPGSARRAA